jgi:hypothetical protein
MRDLDIEELAGITGLNPADWNDEDKLTIAEMDLTDIGQIVQMTATELHLLPLALVAVRAALAELRGKSA